MPKNWKVRYHGFSNFSFLINSSSLPLLRSKLIPMISKSPQNQSRPLSRYPKRRSGCSTEHEDRNVRQFFWLFPLNFCLQSPPRDWSLFERKKVGDLSSGKSCLIWFASSITEQKLLIPLRNPSADCEDLFHIPSEQPCANRWKLQFELLPIYGLCLPVFRFCMSENFFDQSNGLVFFVVFQIVMLQIISRIIQEHPIDFGFFRKISLQIS